MAVKELKYLKNRIVESKGKYVEMSCLRHINDADKIEHLDDTIVSDSKITVGETAAEIISAHIEDVTLTVTCATEDAIIKINGEVRSSITVDKGTEVTYEASKTGFVTVSGTKVVNATETLELGALEPEQI